MEKPFAGRNRTPPANRHLSGVVYVAGGTGVPPSYDRTGTFKRAVGYVVVPDRRVR